MGSRLLTGLRQHFRIPSELPPSPSQRSERKSPWWKRLSAGWTLAPAIVRLSFPIGLSCPSMIRLILAKVRFAHRVSIQIPHRQLPKMGNLSPWLNPRPSLIELESFAPATAVATGHKSSNSTITHQRNNQTTCMHVLHLASMGKLWPVIRSSAGKGRFELNVQQVLSLNSPLPLML